MRNTLFAAAIIGLLAACNAQPANETESKATETEQSTTTETYTEEAVPQEQPQVVDSAAQVADSTVAQ